MTRKEFSSASKQICKRYAVPGVFFSLANICNFAQTGNIPAEVIASSNLVAAGYFANKNNFKTAMRVTSACTLAVGGILVSSVALGASPAMLFPAAAALCFGVGNALASLDKPRISPAVFYGMGYTATAITIAGGMAMLANPVALTLGAVGVAETIYALSKSGKTENAAKPFVGVAAGTLFFAASGIASGNLWGVATGINACLGEINLAIMKQKEHNANNPNWAQEKDWMTTPIRFAMHKGWLDRYPPLAAAA